MDGAEQEGIGLPTLDFKGKQHIYAHHPTVLYRPLVPDTARSLNPAGADDNLIIHRGNFAASRGRVYYEGAGA